jgi:hypothetical protein
MAAPLYTLMGLRVHKNVAEYFWLGEELLGSQEQLRSRNSLVETLLIYEYSGGTRCPGLWLVFFKVLADSLVLEIAFSAQFLSCTASYTPNSGDRGHTPRFNVPAVQYTV